LPTYFKNKKKRLENKKVFKKRKKRDQNKKTAQKLFFYICDATDCIAARQERVKGP